jgi:hypothetical protein
MEENDMSTGLEMKYFVLKPKGTDAYAEASRAAMCVYAKKIRPVNPELARDIDIWTWNEENRAANDEMNKRQAEIYFAK